MESIMIFQLILWVTVLSITNLNYGYELTNEPIDVVIPCTSKDKRTLEWCIEGIRTYGQNINRIIVVSDKKLTDSAEWFDEKLYPFSKHDMALEIFKDTKAADEYLNNTSNRIGWLYQQLLKLYAAFVIPDISSNILILDADTIFLRPISFLDSKTNGCLFNPGSENNRPYFIHGERLIPGFRRKYPNYSGVSHHMLFQRAILEDLFDTVEQVHGKEFWRAFCDCIERSKHHLFGSAASEYEIYFNFTMERTKQCKVRKLKWANMSLHKFKGISRKDYDYISCHAYLG